MSERSFGTRGELTDVRSPRVKAARRLRKRAFREQDGAFLAEGAQAIREAIGEFARDPNGPRVRELFVTADARTRNPAIVEQAVRLGVVVHQASGRVLAELSETVTPQGLVAVCDLRHAAAQTVFAGPQAPALVAVLAAVRDPGNAGTVLRTADAAGADAVVFTGDAVDPYNGKCVRASAGSLFHLPVITGIDAAAAVEQLRASGCGVLAADGNADLDLDECERTGLLARPTAWLFGNEAWGLPPDVARLADRAVAVPVYGRAESLNLAAAAAVCLYATARAQHRRR